MWEAYPAKYDLYLQLNEWRRVNWGRAFTIRLKISKDAHHYNVETYRCTNNNLIAHYIIDSRVSSINHCRSVIRLNTACQDRTRRREKPSYSCLFIPRYEYIVYRAVVVVDDLVAVNVVENTFSCVDCSTCSDRAWFIWHLAISQSPSPWAGMI